MAERILLACAALLLALVVGLALFWHPEPPERVLPKAAGGGGGDFTLQSAGGPVSLSDFKGKVVLLYFGYTYCPDICPTSLVATAAGLKQLSAEEQARVAMIFISVDPERDTPARLKEYVEFFHPNIVGVTGSAESLADIARRYGAFYAKQSVATAGGGYVVDHSADTYVIGTDGKLVGKIAHATPPEQVAGEIRKHLQK
jgi:protein SCO1